MPTLEDKPLIVRFADWFERTYPKETYRLQKSKTGYYIIRADGSTITYCEYYADQLLGTFIEVN